MSSPPSSRTKNDSFLSSSFRPPTFCLKRFATNHLYPLIRFIFSNFLFLMLRQRVNTPYSTILVFFCLFANWPLLPRPRLNILLNLSLRWLNTVFDTYASFTFVSKTLDPLVAKNGTLDEKRIYTNLHSANLMQRYTYSGIPISRTSRVNANLFEKSGVREIEGGIKLRLIGRVLFDYE